VEQNCWGGGNAERQCYVDSPRNVWVEGGALHLRVLPGAHMGSLVGCTSNEENSCTWTQPFTSARINSKASPGTVSPPTTCKAQTCAVQNAAGHMCIRRSQVGRGRPLLEAPGARPLLADNGSNLAVNVPLPIYALLICTESIEGKEAGTNNCAYSSLNLGIARLPRERVRTFSLPIVCMDHAGGSFTRGRVQVRAKLPSGARLIN